MNNLFLQRSDSSDLKIALFDLKIRHILRKPQVQGSYIIYTILKLINIYEGLLII